MFFFWCAPLFSAHDDQTQKTKRNEYPSEVDVDAPSSPSNRLAASPPLVSGPKTCREHFLRDREEECAFFRHQLTWVLAELRADELASVGQPHRVNLSTIVDLLINEFTPPAPPMYIFHCWFLSESPRLLSPTCFVPFPKDKFNKDAFPVNSARYVAAGPEDYDGNNFVLEYEAPFLVHLSDNKQADFVHFLTNTRHLTANDDHLCSDYCKRDIAGSLFRHCLFSREYDNCCFWRVLFLREDGSWKSVLRIVHPLRAGTRYPIIFHCEKSEKWKEGENFDKMEIIYSLYKHEYNTVTSLSLFSHEVPDDVDICDLFVNGTFS